MDQRETANNKPGSLTEYDVYLFKQGAHTKMYEKLGSHVTEKDGTPGVHFAVWAPNADSVSVIGDFNGWKKLSHRMSPRWDESGIWEAFIPGLGKGEVYKYYVTSKYNNYKVEKADPYGRRTETPPKTASVVWESGYEWSDRAWLDNRRENNSLDAPISIYEVHIGSWRRVPEEGYRSLTYREIAPQLAEYAKSAGFTHVEFLPVMEHPFYGSWGYQVTGYFAPTARYGSPEDFMYLIDVLHQNKIGVILDWVPSHFPGDEHGLVYFDGTHLYEHADPRKGFHPDWSSYIFNYSRNEVRAFLKSSAMYWFDQYHIDGVRVDAVASMLYLDYSRNPGEWEPNEYGGNENLRAIDFIKELNQSIYAHHPDVQTIAEESTAWPMVSRPTYVGGLGFGMKWNMGWMNDTLDYFSRNPVHRKYHHNDLTFSIMYTFTENFVLPFSHDEVVHEKGSLLGRMPGDMWQKFANVRALFGYMFGHPGKKLLFMGGEIGQWDEWSHERSIDWHLLQYPLHSGLRRWVQDLNGFYRSEPAMYEIDFSFEGFDWTDFKDYEQSVISFLRKSRGDREIVLVVCNFTPVPRKRYRVRVPRAGRWSERLNSDSHYYGGSGVGNYGGIHTVSSGYNSHIEIDLPPLGVLFFKYEG
ncbi:MAG TPA: 1,4-alpha-glucan branching protein GlgB [Thermodesulfobacteriota bacterium]|nr:1,4-alpha-glucan branching protein GlgB [Thermodesulfobacteriota bacterium]